MRFFPSNKRALAITVVFHIIVLLIFLFVGLTQPDPLPEEIGVEIAMADLGNSNTGQGDNPTPRTNDTPNPTNTTPQAATPTPTASQPKVVQEENTDITTPNAKTESQKVEESTPAKKVEEEAPKRTVNREALYPGAKASKSSSQDGGSQGDRSGRGDMGSEEGKPQGKGILGGGMGSWELSGRSLLKGTTIEDTKEEGIVVLNIWVDQQGNVTRTSPNLAESTTTSQYLFDLATRAAKQSRYSAKSNAAVEQKGKMTFKFILE